MLPYLKPKRQVGVIVSTRKPDGSNEMDADQGDGNHEMEACADEIIRAISAKDSKALAVALQAAHDIMDSDDRPQDEQDSE